MAMNGPFRGWMSLVSDRLVHTDSLVQVALTITLAYISFFVGENEMKVSGVLATQPDRTTCLRLSRAL